jgi:hypothetical protein
MSKKGVVVRKAVGSNGSSVIALAGVDDVQPNKARN